MVVVSEVARCSLPALSVSDERHFAAVMKGLQILPRKADDGLTGELRFRAYYGAMGDLPRDQLDWTMREAIKRHHFFPSVKEMLDIADGWRRADDASLAKRIARAKMRDEMARRERAARPKPLPLTQADIDEMPLEMVRLGIKVGAIVQDEVGRYLPAPEVATGNIQ